jgi:uncharacterized repeat protein (TIGR03847 family)
MDLGAVDKITAEAIGEPGHRVFYIQARSGGEVVTVVAEKEQVVLLATSVLELLADVPVETGPGPDEMELETPFDPLWRIGRLSLGYDPGSDRFVLEMAEQVPEDEDTGEPVREPETIRLAATREQMLALSRHGTEVAQRGRPICQLCGNPMDPEGHECPATNGHRKFRS